jgi:hypothetical protein
VITREILKDVAALDETGCTPGLLIAIPSRSVWIDALSIVKHWVNEKITRVQYEWLWLAQCLAFLNWRWLRESLPKLAECLFALPSI